MRTLVVFSLLTAAPSAWAQGTTTATTSTSRTPTLHPTNSTARIDTYSTRITARLGSGALLHDQTFSVTSADPAVQARIQAARSALNSAGSASITGPTLVSGTTALTNTSTATVVNNTNVTTVESDAVLTFGPGSVLIGDLGLCTGPPPAARQRPTGCPGGTPFTLEIGDVNATVNTNTQSDIFQTVTTTSTFLTSQTYELNGTAPQTPLPQTPAPPSFWLSLAGLAASGAYYLKKRSGLTGA